MRGTAILDAQQPMLTRKETAMSETERIRLTHLTEKGG